MQTFILTLNTKLLPERFLRWHQLSKAYRIRVNMKLLTLILVSFIHHVGHSQTDTIRVDLDEMSIDFRTCECLLFGGCRKFSFPVKADWKRADSLFIGNQDTICFVLEDHGIVKIEGCKKTEGEAFGNIKFYNKHSELSKVEIWEPVYLTNENNAASWSDGYYWATQLVYKKNALIKETTRSLLYDEKKGYAQKTEVITFKNGKKKGTKIKIQYF